MKSLNEILKQPGWRDATPPENGAPAPDLPEEEDVCPLCEGAGYVRRPVRMGHPDFGRAFPCRCVENEREEEKVARLQRYSNLGPLSRLTFENLSPRGRSPNPIHQERFAEAVKAARRFAADPDGWLVFTGPNGCGKTHLAAAIAGACIETGCAALFMVVPDLLDHLRAAYKPNNEVGYDELFELLKSAPVLVLDDLGVQSATPWAQEKLFQLVNHRYNARIPTIFTTNVALDTFDARLRARLSDPDLAQVYYFESGPGPDLDEDLSCLDKALLAGMTFKSFRPELAVSNAKELKDLEHARREAIKYVQDPKNWFVIAGRTGRGKTRLAAAIANYCRDAGRDVLFVVVPDLLDRLRGSYDPDDPRGFERLFQRVRTCELLVLDDLGAHSDTAWASEKLFQLLNDRYNSRRPTVVTTNQTKRNIDPRILTRLTDPQISDIYLIDFNLYEASTTEGRGRPRRS